MCRKMFWVQTKFRVDDPDDPQSGLGRFEKNHDGLLGSARKKMLLIHVLFITIFNYRI